MGNVLRAFEGLLAHLISHQDEEDALYHVGLFHPGQSTADTIPLLKTKKLYLAFSITRLDLSL